MAKGTMQPELPEFASIEAFIECLLDNDRAQFTASNLRELSFGLRRGDLHNIRLELEAYGLQLERRPHEHRARGFTTSSHDRWYGPGSCPTHGGSGFDNRE